MHPLIWLLIGFCVLIVIGLYSSYRSIRANGRYRSSSGSSSSSDGGIFFFDAGDGGSDGGGDGGGGGGD